MGKKDRQYMMYYGEPVTSEMSKEKLLEIIAYLSSELTQTQVRATKYLEAADPVKLLNQK